MQIPFIDLKAQQAEIRDRLDTAIAGVLDKGAYILGPEVMQFEKLAAQFLGVKHCVSCANGTDALLLVLMALGIKPGDAVIAPSFTFAATAEIIPCIGASIVFADCDPDSFNISIGSLEEAISIARENSLTPKAIIAVDLFGLSADYTAINNVANREGLTVISDSAQGFGCKHGNAFAAQRAFVTTTSFFPAKPLGCYGDGGAIFTNDDKFANLLSSLRFHGKGSDKYDNVRIGMNSRLDTLQAAILIEKLAIYEKEIEARNVIAVRYANAMQQHVQVPQTPSGNACVWAQYTIVLDANIDRAELQAELKEKGIPTMVYYPLPLHQQTAYKSALAPKSGLPVSEMLAKRVLSLPMHPYLDESTQEYIIQELISALG